MQVGETEARHSCKSEGVQRPCLGSEAVPGVLHPLQHFPLRLPSECSSKAQPPAPAGFGIPPPWGAARLGRCCGAFWPRAAGLRRRGRRERCRTPGRQQPVALKGSQEPLTTYSNSVHHFFALRKRRAGSKSSASATAPPARPGKAGFLRVHSGLRAWAERGVRPHQHPPSRALGVPLGPPASPVLGWPWMQHPELWVYPRED